MWQRSRVFFSVLNHRLKFLNTNSLYNFSSTPQAFKKGASCNFINIFCAKSSDRLCSTFDFHNVLARSYSESSESTSESNKSDEDRVKVYFVLPNDEEVEVLAKDGDNVMELGVDFVDMEGACNGQMACTTCHVYVDDRFEQHFQEPTDEEDDLIDGAPFRKVNSRLGCCLNITKEMDGIRFGVPKATANFYVDGKRPIKH